MAVPTDVIPVNTAKWHVFARRDTGRAAQRQGGRLWGGCPTTVTWRARHLSLDTISHFVLVTCGDESPSIHHGIGSPVP